MEIFEAQKQCVEYAVTGLLIVTFYTRIIRRQFNDKKIPRVLYKLLIINTCSQSIVQKLNIWLILAHGLTRTQ